MKRDVRCRLRSGLYFNLSAAASRECQHRQRDHENTHALPSKSWGSFVREACKRQAPLTAQNPTPSKYTERGRVEKRLHRQNYLYMRYCLVLSLNAYAARYSLSMTTSGSLPRKSASLTDGEPNLKSNARSSIVRCSPPVL